MSQFLISCLGSYSANCFSVDLQKKSRASMRKVLKDAIQYHTLKKACVHARSKSYCTFHPWFEAEYHSASLLLDNLMYRQK